MARLAPGLTQEMYTGHGDSLLDWTPPDFNWMAPARSPLIINPTYRLVGDKSGWPSADLTYTGDDDINEDLPDAGHTFVYPIYNWGNAPQETINRYLATNVESDDTPSNVGWGTVNWPRYTTNPSLYPHFSAIADPYDAREDEEGNRLYRILVGRTQIPTEQVKDEDWFNLK